MDEDRNTQGSTMVGWLRVTVVGRLEVLDGHQGLTGRLWEPDGSRWTCRFRDNHREVLGGAWMRIVRITGEARKEEEVIDVETVVLLRDDISAGASESKVSPFWESLSLEELAVRQGVSPVSDLDEISSLWPEDDDPDELTEYVLTQRSARRRLIGSGGAA